MTWKDIIKAPPLTPEQEKEVQEEMRFRNLERPDAEKRIRRKYKKTGQREVPTYEDYMSNYKAEEDEITGEDFKALRDKKKPKRRSAFTQED